MEWKGGSSHSLTTRPAKERAGGSSRHGTIIPPLEEGGGGVKSWQDDLTQQNGGGVESSRDNSTPRGGGDPEGDETLGAPTAFQYRGGEDRRGRGGGGKTQPPTRQT